MRLFLIFTGILLIAGCSTTQIIREPVRSENDPSWERLKLMLGIDRNDEMFRKFKTKYRIFQKKNGPKGRYYPSSRSFTLFYHGDKITKILLTVQSPSPLLKAYTGRLPFHIYRRDTYDSLKRKFGEPSYEKPKSILIYEDKGLELHFINGRVSSVTLSAL